MQFDYVIVGAGSAGCALASRLSANPNNSVALFEAGGRDSYPWIHIPVGYFKTMGNPKTDWCYHTEADAGLNGRSIPWPRGKVLGGSSSINGLLYVRGQPQDYDAWRAQGNAGWGWDDISPIFRRIEDWEGGSANGRGVGGPLTVSRSRVSRHVVDAWLKAAVNAGYPWNDDYNGQQQEGVGHFQMTIRDGKRCSSAVAYLRPARNRKNLHVFTNAHVEKVIISEGKAQGIAAQVGDELREVRANHEVILCAGGIGSPQLLMLSGVGDGDQLAKFDIPVQSHLPGVGQNLQDHLQARPVFKCRASTINTEQRSLTRKAFMALQYLSARSGPLTMAASLGTGFLNTNTGAATPDIQFHIQPFSADSPAEGAHKFSAFTASVTQLRPESRGHLALRSPDFRDHPLIYPNYLSTAKDCETIVAGIAIARKIAQHSPVNSLIYEEYSPGKAIAEQGDAAILDWARNTATTIYHPSGTCKMGSGNGAVVDHQLRVYGVEGLRIADASIMPTIVSGNTNGPAIVIGEKAADMISAQ